MEEMERGDAGEVFEGMQKRISVELVRARR